MLAAGTLLLCWARARAAFPATLYFDQPPDVLVDGERWCLPSGGCACFRRVLRVAASTPVIIDLKSRALRGAGVVQISVRESGEPLPAGASELAAARSILGLELATQSLAVAVESGEFASVSEERGDGEGH